MPDTTILETGISSHVKNHGNETEIRLILDNPDNLYLVYLKPGIKIFVCDEKGMENHVDDPRRCYSLQADGEKIIADPCFFHWYTPTIPPQRDIDIT